MTRPWRSTAMADPKVAATRPANWCRIDRGRLRAGSPTFTTGTPIDQYKDQLTHTLVELQRHRCPGRSLQRTSGEPMQLAGNQSPARGGEWRTRRFRASLSGMLRSAGAAAPLRETGCRRSIWQAHPPGSS